MTTDTPLLTDTSIVAEIDAAVGPASQRQLWCFFLGADHTLFPVSLCIDDLPERPARVESAEVGRSLREAAGAIGAESLVAVWERPGDSALEPIDSLWLRSLSDGCTASALPVRAVLLSHDRGVRAVAPVEYGF